MTNPTTYEHRHCIAALIVLVDELRSLQAACSGLTFVQLVADAEPTSEALTAVAEALDRHTAPEVDAELDRLWESALVIDEDLTETTGEPA